MSRIIREYAKLYNYTGNYVSNSVERQYFKTELETEVDIDFSLYTIIFTPEEDDFFTQETLDAICRVLKDNDFSFSEEDGKVFVNIYECYSQETINRIADQVDEKLDVILEEKGIDPNAKNDAFLNLYSDDDDFGYDVYEDIRNMYEEEELPYSEHEYTEPLVDIDHTDFIESLEVKDNTENTENKNWFGFIK